eukprot:sb/3479084/
MLVTIVTMFVTIATNVTMLVTTVTIQELSKMAVKSLLNGVEDKNDYYKFDEELQTSDLSLLISDLEVYGRRTLVLTDSISKPKKNYIANPNYDPNP